MKRKELIIITGIVIGIALFFGLLTLGLSVNDNLGNLLSGALSSKDESAQKQAIADTTPQCSKKSQITLANASTDPHISKLQDYQNMCQSYVTNRLMIFTNFADTKETGTANSIIMAAKLKAFKTSGLSPVVIAEPYVSEGAMSYRAYLSGAYDAGIEQYFKNLKAEGVTDEMLGLWVPFPESNIPEWNNKDTEPRDYALCMNRYLSTLKKYFPGAKTSVLLNATTYEPDDLEYNNGDYLSLVPYLQELNKSLITSIGIQGFPWVSNATQPRREIFRASEFLQPDLAIEAARELRTRDIWFNTGTFAAKYTNSSEKQVTITPNERKAILADILTTVKNTENYQQNEYRVFINLFAENKSEATEATDWAYFQDSESKIVLREFLSKANKLTIPISIYDK